MKRLLLTALLLASGLATAQGVWETSPLNWDNSPLTWKNSPHNWDNSIVSGKNGIYDGSSVQQIGYATTTPSGGTNVYLNNGHRIGYIPPRESRLSIDDDFPELGRIQAMPKLYPIEAPAPVQQVRKSRLRQEEEEDDDYYPPPRRVSVPVKSGFTPLEQPAPRRSGFTPLEQAVPVRSGFTLLDQSAPVRSGFTPLHSGFTPLQ